MNYLFLIFIVKYSEKEINMNIYKFDEDYILLQQIKQGESSAIDTFVRKYYPDILNYCNRRTVNKEDAMDLTQEVFLRFFSTLSIYKHYGKAKNYLYVIANRLCIDNYKTKKDYILFDENIHSKFESMSIEQRISIQTSIQILPPTFKEVVLLYYYQGLTIKEISRILSISIPLVKYRLAQAKKLIKRKMEEEK